MTIFHNHKVVADNLPWLNDSSRNNFYKEAIQSSVQGKRVLEVGAGAGLLMQYALDAGAEHVTGVEIRKERAKFLNRLFESQGHKNYTILNADFMSVEKSMLSDIDVVICEQTGDQFNNDCQLLKVFDRLKDLDVVGIPDSYNIDVHVFDGQVEKTMPLVTNDSIPDTYQKALKSMVISEPTDSFENIWSTSINKGAIPVSIELDLTGYKDCTLYIDDYVSFKGKRCPYLTGYENWNKPYTYRIDDAKGIYNINFTDGLWKHEKKS